MKRISLSLVVILGFYLLSFWLVSPIYEYPIGDDWTYSRVAKTFHETGRFETLPWYGQSLVVQIWWSFLFLLPFGFSFSALHLSSAAMGALAIFFFYGLMRSLQFKEREAFWGCLLLTISPPFVFVSRTFYTDLPFLALYLGAAWAYVRGFSERKGPWFLIGSLFMGLSVLVRQVGIFLPLVVFVILLRDRRRWALGQRLTLLIPFLSLGFFTLWQHYFFKGAPPANILLMAYALRSGLMIDHLVRLPFLISLYFGFILSRILIPSAFGLFQKRESNPKSWRLFLLGLFIFSTVILFMGFREGLWMLDHQIKGFHLKGAGFFPYAVVTLLGVMGASLLWAVYYEPVMGHLRKTGVLLSLSFLVVGSLLTLPPVRTALLSLASSVLTPVYGFFSERIRLFQTLETWQERLPLLVNQIRVDLIWAGLVGLSFFALLPHFTKCWKGSPSRDPIETPEVVLHLASAAYLSLLLVVPLTMDRYLFPVFPSAILLVLRAARPMRLRRDWVTVLLLCVTFFSFSHMDRTIQRVGALWEGGGRLIRQGIPAEKIDAGFVFNGWHLDERRGKGQFEGTDKGWTNEGWWVKDSEYRITQQPDDRYRIFGKIPYRDLLTPGADVVYLTKRKERM